MAIQFFKIKNNGKNNRIIKINKIRIFTVTPFFIEKGKNIIYKR